MLEGDVGGGGVVEQSHGRETTVLFFKGVLLFEEFEKYWEIGERGDGIGWVGEELLEVDVETFRELDGLLVDPVLEEEGGFVADVEVFDGEKGVADGEVLGDEGGKEFGVVSTIEERNTFFDLGEIPLVIGIDLRFWVFLVEEWEKIKDMSFKDLLAVL